MSQEARIFGWARKMPRLYQKSEDSVEAWLTDQAWIIRKDQEAGTDDGTPIFTDDTFGPYSAKLSTPSRAERRDDDLRIDEESYTILIRSDEEPRERDRLRVRTDDALYNFRILTTTLDRNPVWGGAIWHAELARTDEY